MVPGNQRSLAVAIAVIVVLGYTIGVAAVGSVAGVTAESGDAGMGSYAQQASGVTGEIDLADADTKIVGDDENDTSGWSVATGDANGDRQTDLLIGSTRNDSSGESAGAAYLFYGPVDPGTVDLSEADVTFVGEGAGDDAGAAVAIGDTDGDDTAEIVVGAPDNDTAGTNAGAVYVHEVAAGTSGEVSLSDVDTKLLGESAQDRAGVSVTVPENETAEGALLVGVAAYDDDTGAAYLVRNPSAGTQSLADARATFVGESSGDRAGYSVAFAGDVDGDDSLDAIVGAPGWQNDTGAAYLLSDVRSASGTVNLGDADARFEGAAEGDMAGWAVALAGDVDDDEYDDVVVGAPGNDAAEEDAGAAYVVLGSSDPSGTASLSNADVVLEGEAEGDRAGYSVASAGSGDVTCDEIDDVLVGAPGNDSTATDAGAAYVVAGSETAGGTTSLADATAKLSGVAEDDRAGFAVADGGDLNADGDEDAVVTAPYHDDGQDADVGATYVVHGDCPKKTEAPTDTPTDTLMDTKTSTETKTPEKTPERAGPPEKTPTETPTKTPKDTPERTATDTPTDMPTETKTTTEKPLGVDVTSRCVDDDGKLTVENPNQETDVRVTVRGPGGYSASATLGPGENKTFQGLADGRYTVRTFVDGERIDRQRIQVQCDAGYDDSQAADSDGQNSIPMFPIAWSVGSLALVAGLIYRQT